MARGGKRAGAGRKPGQKKRRAVVVALDGSRFEAPQVALSGVPDDPHGLLTPPDDLPADEQACWTQFAPFALSELTLTPATAVGFQRFCKQWTYCVALDTRIRELGIATHEADGLLKRLEKWEQRLDSSLGNFKLRSFGKPATSEKAKPKANTWGTFGKAR